MSSYEMTEWVKLIARWIHVFAGILWIGQTYLFNFMERNFERDDQTPDNVRGNLWMVHGGGLYHVEKQKFRVNMPQTLHWFRWEAMITWLSGFVLILLTYYMGGLLVEPGMDYWTATWTAIGTIVAAWVLYDLMVESPLGKNEYLVAVIGFAGILGITYLFCQVMAGRAAYMHVGALFGTIMVANVWIRILPSQSKMLAAAEAGQRPDEKLSTRGPLRSKHNSYMVIPLVFLMISNHFPTIAYGHEYNWIILGVLVLLGWGAAKLFTILD